MNTPRFPARSLRYFFVLSTLLFLQGGWTAEPPEHAQNKIGSAVRAAILADGGANVMIALSHPGAKLEGKGLNLAALRSDIQARQSSVMSAVGSGFKVKENFSAVPAMAGRIMSSAALEALAQHPHVLKVDLELSGVGHLEQSVPLIGADLRQLVGNTGTGVVVAVLDSGVDTDHTDLGDNLLAEACFADDDGAIDGSGQCPNGSDRQTGPGSAEDDAGHGTHVTGIITSGGVVGPIGVAPNASFVAVKITYGPSFSGAFASFSEVVAGLNYIINNPGLGVQLINMSVGTNAEYPGDCDGVNASTIAGAAAIDTLRAAGVTTFASAGNNTNLSQMSLPACLSNVISVGASDNNDVVANFSNASTTTDIFAPGVGTNSSAINDGTTIASGTSMASPTAAGCAALLIESGDATTPNDIETWLESSSILINVPGNGMSYPRIDCDPLVNVPPVCNANGPYVAECGVALNLDGSGSTDPNGDSLSYAWSGPIIGGSAAGVMPSVIFHAPTGAKNIMLEVDDSADSAQCSSPVTVQDTLAPSVTAPADLVEECADPAGNLVAIGSASATDTCDANPAIMNDAPGLFPLGDTTVNWTATDADGNQSGDQQTVSITDTMAPVISCNNPADITPNGAPANFTTSAADQCQGPVAAEVTGYNCYKMTKKGKLVSKLKSCVVSFDGDEITIEDSGGVADMISWDVTSVDAQGNQASQTCQLAISHPRN